MEEKLVEPLTEYEVKVQEGLSMKPQEIEPLVEPLSKPDKERISKKRAEQQARIAQLEERDRMRTEHEAYLVKQVNEQKELLMGLQQHVIREKEQSLVYAPGKSKKKMWG
jgi:hypothetical protein